MPAETGYKCLAPSAGRVCFYLSKLSPRTAGSIFFDGIAAAFG